MHANPPAGSPPLVSIIVTAYNKVELTRQCLDALFRHTNLSQAELIVVDNGSADDTPAYLASLPEPVTVLTLRPNQGYAKACNRAARLARGRYLVFVSNDVMAKAGWLEGLVDAAETDPHVGAVGAKLLLPGTDEIQHAGVVFGAHLLPYHLYYGMKSDHPAVNRRREFQAVTAACFLVRRDAFEAIGGFDEAYWNGYEDVDLCLTLRQHGYRVVYAPESCLEHHDKGTLRKDPAQEKDHRNNTQMLQRKWQGRLRQDDAEYYAEDGFVIERTPSGVRLVPSSPHRTDAFDFELTPLNHLRLVPKRLDRAVPVASIIIPTYNQLALTKECFQALFAHTDMSQVEVIAVDNASTDGTPEYLRTLEGKIRVIYHSENLGFARGCNQGVRVARGEHLVFLNNDTIPQPGWLEGLLDVVNRNPSVGVVGAKLLFPGTRQIQHAGVVFGPTLIPYHIYYGLDADHPAVNREREFEVVTAACCLIRRQLFLELGGFDEGYLNGYEDVDLCLRMRAAGYRVVYTPKSLLYHHHQASIRQDPHHQQKAQANTQRLHTRWKGQIRCNETAYYEEDGFEVVSVGAERQVRPGPARHTAGAVLVTYNTPTTQIAIRERARHISVVVVTYNSRTELPTCLESLYQYTDEPFELILVDNASTDGTQEYLKQLDGNVAGIKALLNDENAGFAKAINRGIRESSGQFVVILNPDTQVTPAWLGRMVAHVNDGVGAVGPLSNYVCGHQRLDLYLPGTEGMGPEAIAGRLATTRAGQAVESKLLVFFCTLIPRAVLDRVGLLDEDFFLNHEDFEFAWRLTRARYRLVVATDAFVYHKGEASKGSLSQGKNLQYVYESARVLHRKLEAFYGKGHVPSSTELWGFEIFGLDPSGRIRQDLPGSLLKDYVPPKSSVEEPQLSEINKGSQQKRPRVALIYDNTIRPDTTGEYCKLALQQIAEVVHFLPSQLSEIPPSGFDLYLHIDDSLKYTLPPHLRPSAWWVIDTHLQYDWDLEKARGFDFVFCAQKDGAECLQRDGIHSALWLPLACDPEIHKKHPIEKAYDVAFVGNFLPGPRTELLDLIREYFPNSFVGQAYFEEMAKIYSQARIVFNRSVKNDINMRVFEALASGSLLVTNDLSDNGQSELFQDKIHLVTYRNPGEMLARISYYLEREEERERIGARGREEILAKHTYLHRMQKVLETCLEAAPGLVPIHLPTATRRALPPHLTSSAETQRGDGAERGLPKASIVILAWNQLDYTRACVESVIRHTKVPHELILVDNGSTDGTLDYFRSIPGAKVVANGRNLGFGAGNNRGIQVATGECVVLLNNDTIVTQGWLERMIICAQSDAAIGIVGPVSNYVSGPQLDQEARYETIEAMETYASQVAQQHKGQWVESERIVGFCMLIKRAVVERIGLLDERFGIGNFEDDDYCLRARQVGFRLTIARDVFIHHFGSRTFIGNQVDFRQAMERGHALFLSKWGDQAPQAYRVGATPISSLLAQGIRSMEEERYEDAAQAFRSALALEPASSEAWNNLGCVLVATGCLEEAESCFLKAISFKPENARAHRNMGDLYYLRQAYGEAIPHYEETLRLNARETEAIVLLANCYLHQGAYASAELGYRAVLEREPSHAEARENLEATLALQRSGGERSSRV